MITKVTLGKAGRVALPKRVLEELHLAPGDSLVLRSSGREIALRPMRGKARIQKKQGVWVLRAGVRLRRNAVDETIRRVREERSRQILRTLR